MGRARVPCAWAVMVAVTVGLAGCGLPGGGLGSPPGPARGTGTTPPAPAQRALGGWRSPVQAVQVFAQTYINWTADTVATHLHVLAQAAIGQARSAMTLAAGQVGQHSAIARGGVANSGIVEGIAPVTSQRNVYAVVTRERTTATHTNAYQGV